MTGDLTIRFGGDTSGLTAAANQAKQSIASITPSADSAKTVLDALSATMRQAKQASDDTSASFLKMTAAFAVAMVAADAVEALGSAFASASGAALDFAGSVQKAEITAEYDAIKALTGALVDYSVIAAKAVTPDAFTSTITAAEIMIDRYRLLGTNAERATLDAVAAGGGLDAFANAATKAGVSVKDFTAGFLAQIEQIPGMSDEAAISIEGMLGSIPDYSADANTALISVIAMLSATAAEAVTNAKAITDAFKDESSAGGATLATMVGKLVDGLQASIDKTYVFREQLADFKADLEKINEASIAFGQRLQPAGAIAYYTAVIGKLQAANAEQKHLTDDATASLQRYGVLGEAVLAIESQRFDRERAANAERQKTIDLLNQQLIVQQSIKAASDRQEAFETTLDKANPIDAQIGDVQSKISLLQGQLSRGTSGGKPQLSADDITTLVRTIIGEAGDQSPQGQLAVAAVALNRLANGNFGDSLTKVLKAGDGSQFNTWKPLDKGGSASDQANAPASTDSWQYKEVLYDIVKPLLDGRQQDPTGGALNFYNPSLTPTKNQFPMTDRKTIGDHDFGTAVGSPKPLDPLDDDTVAKTQQALDTFRAKLKQLQDEKAGGNALDQAGLEIAQRHANGLQDQVADQKKMVAAAQAEVDASGNLSVKDQNAAEKRLDTEKAILREKQAEAAIATSKVDAAGLQKDSFAQVAVLNQALAQKLALYSQEDARYKTVLDEMSANTKRAVDKQTADVAAAVKLQIERRKALGDTDPVPAAQRALDVAKGNVTKTGQTIGADGAVAGTDPGNSAQVAAANAYYAALEKLREADVAQDKAAQALKTANTAENSAERFKSEMESYARRLSEAGNNATEIMNIEAAKATTIRAYNKEVATEAAADETTKYENAKRSLDDQLTALKANHAEGAISSLQLLDQTKSIQDQQLALERGHLQALAQIWQGQPKEYLKVSEQLKRIDAQRVSEGQKAQQDFEKGIVESYTHGLEEVGSSISSTLLQMEQGTAKFRDLLRNVVLNIEQQFLNAGVKMVADWAANQTKNLAITVATQAQQTGAVIAGDAAREASTVGSTAASAAATAASTLAAIGADAAKAAAGVTAFLSGLIGPAALGVGASIEGGVMAFASAIPAFDVGSWALPSSGLAMVHAGEMIVPAAQTPWAQSLLANGGGAGGGRAAPIEPHFHIHAIDTQSGMQFIDKHIGTFSKKLNQHWQYNRTDRPAF